MKSEIDIDRLFFKKSFYTRCFNSLGTRQIDQMNGCDCFDIASWLGTLDVDDEDTMWTSGFIVLWCFADYSVRVSDEQIV